MNKQRLLVHGVQVGSGIKERQTKERHQQHEPCMTMVKWGLPQVLCQDLVLCVASVTNKQICKEGLLTKHSLLVHCVQVGCGIKERQTKEKHQQHEPCMTMVQWIFRDLHQISIKIGRYSFLFSTSLTNHCKVHISSILDFFGA